MALRSPLTVQPYDYISDSTGRPLDKGQIYIGVAGQDPEFYQIPIYLDAEMTKLIDQPIRTNDGFVDFAGSLSELYASAEIYSVKVLDKQGRKVLYKGDTTRKNLMSDALADLNQSIVDAQSAAQTAIDTTVNNASIVITNVSTDATAAIDNAVLISNDAASRADSAIQDLFESGGLPATPFETKAQMTASPKADGTYAVVTNDAITNNGVYLKKSGAWALVPWNNFSNLDELRVNKDKDYPLSIFVRSASASSKQQIYFKQALVGAEVVNARKGYYYRFAYMQNGQVFAGVEQNYGVIIERVNILTKVTQKLTNYTDYDVQLKPDRTTGGLQTFNLKCVADPLTIIKVTIDVDALVGDGKAITSTSSSADGYNSIIHPKNHYYFDELSFTSSDMLVNYNYTGKLSVSYLSKTKWYRLDFARKSENLTFQNAGFGYAEAYGEFGDLIPPEYAKFVTRAEADSDWHSPLRIRAVSNGDAGATLIYTGGAHSKDGNTAGGATARSRNITILVDGIAIDPTKNLLAKCKAVSCLVTNQLMAYNTIATDRYVLEQNYRYDISPKGQYVAVSYKALEDIVIEKDNGLQAYMAGMTPITNNTYLFVGGSQIERKSVTETSFNSGLKSAYPDAYGVVIRHPVAGEMSVWIDNKYGVGDRQYLASTRPLFEHAVSSSTKIYARLIDGVELPLSKNKSYQWRGGMYWGMPTNTAYQDSVLHMQSGSLLVSVDGSYAIV